jgi:hypothetical protein
VLFADLSYAIGLFTKTNLSPLDAAYPRITRPLIVKLIDYNILDYPSKLFSKKMNEKEIFLEFNRNNKGNELTEDFWEEQVKKRKGKATKAEAKKGDSDSKKHKNWERYEEFRKEKAKEVVMNWKISAESLEKISNVIYEKDNIPKFYNEVERDFQRKYVALLERVRSMLKNAPLPPKCLRSEKGKNFLQEHPVLKELSEELDKLKKHSRGRILAEDRIEEKNPGKLEKH